MIEQVDRRVAVDERTGARECTGRVIPLDGEVRADIRVVGVGAVRVRSTRASPHRVERTTELP